MSEKNQLLDTVKYKEDELKIMRDPQGVKSFGDIQTELDIYIRDLGIKRKESSVALKSLKVFMDKITNQKASMIIEANGMPIRSEKHSAVNESSIT